MIQSYIILGFVAFLALAYLFFSLLKAVKARNDMADAVNLGKRNVILDLKKTVLLKEAQIDALTKEREHLNNLVTKMTADRERLVAERVNQTQGLRELDQWLQVNHPPNRAQIMIKIAELTAKYEAKPVN